MEGAAAQNGRSIQWVLIPDGAPTGLSKLWVLIPVGGRLWHGTWN